MLIVVVALKSQTVNHVPLIQVTVNLFVLLVLIIELSVMMDLVNVRLVSMKQHLEHVLNVE